MAALSVWFQFIISAGLVIVGGSFLARRGKEMAERWGLTELWVGFIFLAAVTSLPELVTALGAVLVARAPSLALADILGSNAFNLFIVALLNIYSEGLPFTSRLSLAPFRLLFALILLMTVLVLIFMVLERQEAVIAFGNTDLASWFLLVLYLLGAREIFRAEHPRDEIPQRREKRNRPGKNRGKHTLYFGIFFCTLLVVGGGFWLARTGREIAELTGWGESFVGALFLALVTSLPEVAVCLASVKIGAAEMGLGNILGSNIFNLGIIFWTDLAYRAGPLLAGAEPSNFLAGGLGLVLLAAVALAIKLKPGKFGRFLSWDTILITGIYLAGMYFLFKLSAI